MVWDTKYVTKYSVYDTGLMIRKSGFDFPKRTQIFLFSTTFYPALRIVRRYFKCVLREFSPEQGLTSCCSKVRNARSFYSTQAQTFNKSRRALIHRR